MATANWLNEEKYWILDGGMGTMLQSLGLQAGQRPELLAVTQPDLLAGVHRAYLQAGAQIIYANTFGASPHKLEGSGYSAHELIQAAMKIARKEAEPFGAKVALDIGPLGELLEPNGTLDFEEAVQEFACMVNAAKEFADLVVVETMTDLQEARAALLAVKENSDLPVFVSMSFEENGRTFTGCSVEAFAACIGGMGAEGLGINCSLGPVQILPLAERLASAAPAQTKVFVKPNAGLPDPATGEYHLNAEDFAQQMQPYASIGVAAVGGCCGTTPEHIRMLRQAFQGKPAQRTPKVRSIITSAVSVVDADEAVVVGERINPTGKKRFQQALRQGDMDYILSQAVEQTDAGAQMLDVNVGLPDIDEPEMMLKTVKALQTVTDVPLQLDSTDPKALEKGLRVYCGKALVNSVNGEEKSLNAILPLCKKYGAAVIGLALDENGIPPTAEGRVAVARKIVDAAACYGIPAHDVYIDCLTLTASAQQEGAMETLKALTECKRTLGVRSVLGVSNISFGLPCREYLNTAFLTMALYAGLDLAIINPNAAAMMAAIRSYRVLSCKDIRSESYIDAYAGAAVSQPAAKTGEQMSLAQAVEKGLKSEATQAAKLELQTKQPLDIVNTILIPALDTVGDRFEKGTLFLPQLLQSAGAAQAAFEPIKAAMERSGSGNANRGKIVIATVKGDIHDIGKNIVKVILENYGYDVTDLGRDVPPETVVKAVKETGAPLVGLSALMTTTLPSMKETIRQLHEEKLPCKIMVGGAVLTPEYAQDMGADFYAKDAKHSADIAKQVFEG